MLSSSKISPILLSIIFRLLIFLQRQLFEVLEFSYEIILEFLVDFRWNSDVSRDIVDDLDSLFKCFVTVRSAVINNILFELVEVTHVGVNGDHVFQQVLGV